MCKMIMTNEQLHTPMTALETGLGSLRQNQLYGWNAFVDHKPEDSLFTAIIIANFRKLYHTFSGSFYSRFKRSVQVGTGTRWARTV